MSKEQSSALSQAQGLLKNLEDNLSGKDGYAWKGALEQVLCKQKPSWLSFANFFGRNKGADFYYQAAQLLEKLTENLSGEDGYVWLSVLKQFLRKENPVWWSSEALEHLHWKTIMCGTYRSYRHVCEVYAEHKIQIFGGAKAVIEKLLFKHVEPHAVNFGLFTIMDLGFNEDDKLTYKQILKRAKEKGLKKCTRFDAITLRVEYTDQPVNQHMSINVLVCTEVMDNEVFDLVNGHGCLILSTMIIKAKFGTNKFGKDCKFVFRF